MSTPIEQAVREIDSYVARAGWDGPVRIFALVDVEGAIRDNPALADELTEASGGSEILSVEQEGLPKVDSIEELLGHIVWPADVDGAAVCLERITLPPEAEADIPEDPAQAERFAAEDPRREDVRIVVGVMKIGGRWCTIRLRSHDSDAEVLGGADLVPELIEAVAATLQA